MVKIESLKDYIGILSEEEFIRLAKKIYDIILNTKNGFFISKFLGYLRQMEKSFLQEMKTTGIKLLLWLA